jgi:hypothetical protein
MGGKLVQFRQTIMIVMFFLGGATPLCSQQSVYQLYGIQLLSSLSDIQQQSLSIRIAVEDPISPVFEGVFFSGGPLLSLEFSKLTSSGDLLDSYKLTGISRVDLHRNLNTWTGLVMSYSKSIGLYPEVIENGTLKMAVWRFSDTNSVLNVSFNYGDNRIIERLNWDLTTVLNMLEK